MVLRIYLLKRHFPKLLKKKTQADSYFLKLNNSLFFPPINPKVCNIKIFLYRFCVFLFHVDLVNYAKKFSIHALPYAAAKSDQTEGQKAEVKGEARTWNKRAKRFSN